MKESVRSSLFSVVLLIFILMMGALGYWLIEGDHNFWEAFRRTVATITPMSITDLHELSHGGQVFSVVS